MKIKIISDGTSMGTTVINEQTGEELQHVVAVRWYINAVDANAIASVSIMEVPVEITTDAAIIEEKSDADSDET